jgi:hypothetical protein
MNGRAGIARPVLRAGRTPSVQTTLPKEVVMEDPDIERRLLLLAPFLAAFAAPAAQASPIDAGATFVLPAERIAFQPWGNLPPHSGEMAKLYGDFDKPGPYLVMMKWYPGFFSAPHSYATDRIQVVVAGTWWVNSGGDFAPHDAVPVNAAGFVKRLARTPHYDGVPRTGRVPAVIAVFGIGPVDIRLVDPGAPSWRQV